GIAGRVEGEVLGDGLAGRTVGEVRLCRGRGARRERALGEGGDGLVVEALAGGPAGAGSMLAGAHRRSSSGEGGTAPATPPPRQPSDVCAFSPSVNRFA